MSRRIMVPLDGSKLGLAGLAAARALATTGDILELVTVVEETPAFAAPDYEVVASSEAKKHLREIASDIGASAAYSVETAVLVGHPGETLADRSRLADLVIVATHGRSGLSRMWLGSVADHLMREAPAPVVMIPSDVELEGTRSGSLSGFTRSGRVLIPLDGSEFSEGVLETIESQFAEASVTLLRIVEPLPPIAYPYLAQPGNVGGEPYEGAREAAREDLEEVAARLRERGLDVRTHVMSGAYAAEGILQRAAEDPPDLIALATHGAGGIKRLVLGSVADKVVRASSVPVLVVKPESLQQVGPRGDGWSSTRQARATRAPAPDRKEIDVGTERANPGRDWTRPHAVKVGAVEWRSVPPARDPAEGPFGATGPSGRVVECQAGSRPGESPEERMVAVLQVPRSMTWVDAEENEAYVFEIQPASPARVAVSHLEGGIHIVPLPEGRCLTGLSDEELRTLVSRAKHLQGTARWADEGGAPVDPNP